MAKDYYVILGVSRGAAPGQIKQAYRRIAKRYHPDLARSQADADKFIEVQEAYDTLADAARRRSYDATLERQAAALHLGRTPGAAPTRRRTPYREMEPLASFVDEFFEGLVPGVHPQRRGRTTEKDLYLEVVLSPRESREGGLFPIAFPVLEPCPHCGREGLLDAFFCPACRGCGAVETERQFSLSIPPNTAHGTEVTLSLEDIGLRRVLLHVWVQVDPSLEDY
jgi:DnaJ-class molecular chaperone